MGGTLEEFAKLLGLLLMAIVLARLKRSACGGNGFPVLNTAGRAQFSLQSPLHLCNWEG